MQQKDSANVVVLLLFTNHTKDVNMSYGYEIFVHKNVTFRLWGVDVKSFGDIQNRILTEP